MRIIFSLIIILSLTSCKPNSSQTVGSNNTLEAQGLFTSEKKSNNHLDPYWTQGKAELNRFALEQNRYKDVHPGDVVLIFVSEDFLTDKQVKNDYYQNPNSTQVIKTNMLRRFTTGIYDYSMMTSVFTPSDTENYPHTLKVSMTGQDWCGHVFQQYNYIDDAYRLQLFSYFENEGDKLVELPGVMLEDEIWNRIRLNPEELPVGEFDMIPSSVVSRLMHYKLKPYSVVTEKGAYKGSDFEGENLQAYKIDYPDWDRSLEIVFEGNSPYKIVGWKDVYPSVFDKEPRKTVARLTHQVMEPYWGQNSLADIEMRKSLGL